MFYRGKFLKGFHVALPAEGVDRNAPPSAPLQRACGSPSPRRAWIEISKLLTSKPKRWSPSPRRAWIEIRGFVHPQQRCLVALPAEGVDRNPLALRGAPCGHVALLTEGVDRNRNVAWGVIICVLSPSSRRAWIEIGYRPNWSYADYVALLTEGVDRNFLATPTKIGCCRVALLTEGVDRNLEFFCWENVIYVALLTEGVDRNWVPACWAVRTEVALLTEGVDRNSIMPA